MSTPKDFVAGATLTAAQIEDLAQGVLTVATGTSSVGPTSLTTELDVITASAVTLVTTNRRIRITLTIPALVQSNAPDGTFELRIKEGATTLQAHRVRPQGITDSGDGVEFSTIVASPTAAAHTYKATILRVSATGTNATVVASATLKIQLVVEDVGTA